MAGPWRSSSRSGERLEDDEKGTTLKCCIKVIKIKETTLERRVNTHSISCVPNILMWLLLHEPAKSNVGMWFTENHVEKATSISKYKPHEYVGVWVWGEIPNFKVQNRWSHSVTFTPNVGSQNPTLSFHPFWKLINDKLKCGPQRFVAVMFCSVVIGDHIFSRRSNLFWQFSMKKFKNWIFLLIVPKYSVIFFKKFDCQHLRAGTDHGQHKYLRKNREFRDNHIFSRRSNFFFTILFFSPV